MKIVYLGTGAAEAIPALFCKCRVCQSARENGGREIRSRAQAIINNEVLIDFGPDAYMHSVKYNISYEDMKFVLITHAHSDHFANEEIGYIAHGFAKDIGDKPLRLYAGKTAYDILKKDVDARNYSDRLDLVLVEPYKTYSDGNYHFTPLKANHSEPTTPYIYLINDGKKTMLYAHDTGYFYEETWDYLIKNKIRVDYLSLDLTCQLLNWGRDGHLNFENFKEVLKRLKENNIIDDKTVVVANHFSHNGLATYQEMQDIASKENVIISYDGMEMNI